MRLRGFRFLVGALLGIGVGLSAGDQLVQLVVTFAGAVDGVEFFSIVCHLPSP